MAVFVIVMTGQSNSYGQNPGGPGQTLAAIRYWDTNLMIADCNAWHDLDDDHGADYSLGTELRALGHRVAILNISKSATSSAHWASGTTHNQAVAEFEQALPLLEAEYGAGEVFRFIHVRNQGEAEAQTALLATVEAWDTNTLSWHADLTEVIQTYFPAVASVPLLVVGTNSNIELKTHPGVLEAEQAGAGDAYYDPTGNHVYEADGVHYTTAGYISLGQALAPLVAGLITGLESTMGALSSYARTAAISHVRNKSAYSAAATHYVAAYVSGVEVTGSNYSRASLTNNKTTWSDAASGAITNDVAFTFPDASASWGTIDEIRIHDHATAGNELARHSLSAPVAISDSTGPLTIPIGEIDITISGGFTTTVANEFLDLMFGATANSARATVYGTYFVGRPSTGGTETSATRTAITQATAWNAASGGLAVTATDIALADESDATWYAEYTASTLGTLLFEALLPTTPSGGIIPAGALRTSLT